MNDLRNILSGEIDRLIGGTTNAQNVNAVTNAVSKIIMSVKVELEYYKFTGKKENMPAMELIEAPKVLKDSNESL